MNTNRVEKLIKELDKMDAELKHIQKCILEMVKDDKIFSDYIEDEYGHPILIELFKETLNLKDGDDE